MDLSGLLLLGFCRLRQTLFCFSHTAPTLRVILVTIKARNDRVGFLPQRKVIFAACVSACENMGMLCCHAAMKHEASSSSAFKEEEGEDHLPTAPYSFLMNHSHHLNI